MYLSSHDAFCLAQQTHQATKAIFVLLNKKNFKGIGSLSHFYISPSAIMLLQNFLPTTTDHHYQALNVKSKPLKFTTAVKLLLKSTTYYRNLQTRHTHH